MHPQLKFKEELMRQLCSEVNTRLTGLGRHLGIVDGAGLLVQRLEHRHRLAISSSNEV